MWIQRWMIHYLYLYATSTFTQQIWQPCMLPAEHPTLPVLQLHWNGQCWGRILILFVPDRLIPPMLKFWAKWHNWTATFKITVQNQSGSKVKLDVYHVFVWKVTHTKNFLSFTLSLLWRMPLSKVFQAYTSMKWQTHYTSKPTVFKISLKLLFLHSSSLIPIKCCNFDRHHFYCKAVKWFIPPTVLKMWTVNMYILCTFLGSQKDLSLVTVYKYQVQIIATCICQISMLSFTPGVKFPAGIRIILKIVAMHC